MRGKNLIEFGGFVSGLRQRREREDGLQYSRGGLVKTTSMGTLVILGRGEGRETGVKYVHIPEKEILRRRSHCSQSYQSPPPSRISSVRERVGLVAQVGRMVPKQSPKRLTNRITGHDWLFKMRKGAKRQDGTNSTPLPFLMS